MRISDWSSDVCSSDLLYMLPDGGTARSLVYASGAWLTELFPQILTPQRLSAVRHQIFHFGPGQGDTQFRPPAMPALVDRAYGFNLLPDIEGVGVWVWKSVPDASVDPDRFSSEERREGKECVSTVRSWWAPYPEKQKLTTRDQRY